MTKKPNFAKFILGTVVLALLFIGTWAATSARLTSAKKSAAFTATTAAALPLSMPAPTATPPFVRPIDLFELEGNIADDPALLKDDWATVNCPNTGTPPGSGGTSVVHTGVKVDGINQSIFTTGGSKDTLDITGWKWKDGSVPPKDEILNIYAAKYVDGDDNILVFGAERIVTNGSAFIGVWFFQDDVSLNTNGNFNGAHQVGDVLVLNEFSGGGAVANAKVFQWVTSAAQCSLPGEFLENTNLCDITGTAPLGSVFSTTNQLNEIPATEYCWPYTSGSGSSTMPVQSFFEGGINVEAFPALAGACFSSFLIETRSSFSTGSQLKDFALADFNTCVEFTCGKVVAPTSVCEGDPVDYEYTFTNTGGIEVTVDLSDDKLGSLYTGHVVAIGATDTFTVEDVILPPGVTENEATFTVHSAGQPDETCKSTASVTVHENPTAVVSGDNSYCADNVHLVTIQAALTGTGPWDVTWSDGVTQTGVTTSPASRQVNPSSTTVYTVTAVSDAFCSGTASGSATITVNPNATVDQPGNQILCNGAMTDAITFTGSAGATFAWSNNNTSIGLAASGNGGIAAFTATNSGTTNAVATITVTPTSGALCVGPSKQFTITVKPTPHVDQPANQELCNGAQTSAINFSGDVGGATYAWTNDTPSIGLAANGSGNIAAFTATNAGTTNVVATITVTPTADGCSGPSKNFTITVKPTPTVEICPDPTEAASCSTDEDLLLKATVNPAGGTITYSWTKVGDATELGIGPTLLVNAPGTYRVDISRDGCTASDTIHVGLCAGCSP